jgi:hypothetical protein
MTLTCGCNAGELLAELLVELHCSTMAVYQ